MISVYVRNIDYLKAMKSISTIGWSFNVMMLPSHTAYCQFRIKFHSTWLISSLWVKKKKSFNVEYSSAFWWKFWYSLFGRIFTSIFKIGTRSFISSTSTQVLTALFFFSLWYSLFGLPLIILFHPTGQIHVFFVTKSKLFMFVSKNDEFFISIDLLCVRLIDKPTSNVCWKHAIDKYVLSAHWEFFSLIFYSAKHMLCTIKTTILWCRCRYRISVSVNEMYFTNRFSYAIL